MIHVTGGELVSILALLVTGAALAQSRHAARRYKSENQEADNLRHDNQIRVQDMVLGRKGIQGVPDIDGIDSRVTEIHRVVLELAPLVRSINAELHPNGGKSMKDQLNELVEWKESLT